MAELIPFEEIRVGDVIRQQREDAKVEGVAAEKVGNEWFTARGILLATINTARPQPVELVERVLVEPTETGAQAVVNGTLYVRLPDGTWASGGGFAWSVLDAIDTTVRDVSR